MAENLEREISQLSNFTEIVRKFVQRLGDPSKFTFEGEVIDLGRVGGKCTCDEAIRYIFLIHGPNGEVAPCGSTCIKHFESYNPDLYRRLTGAHEGLLAKLAQDERDRVEALRQAELSTIKPEYDAAVARFQQVCNDLREKNSRKLNPSRFPLPYAMWQMETKLKPKEYKSTLAYIKFYKKMIGEVLNLLGKFERGELNQW